MARGLRGSNIGTPFFYSRFTFNVHHSIEQGEAMVPSRKQKE